MSYALCGQQASKASAHRRDKAARSRTSRKRTAGHNAQSQPLDFSMAAKASRRSVCGERTSLPLPTSSDGRVAPSFLVSPTSMTSSRSSCTPPQSEPLDLSSARRPAQVTPPMGTVAGGTAFSPVKPVRPSAVAQHGAVLLEPAALAAIHSLLALSTRWQPVTPSSASVRSAASPCALQPVRLPPAIVNQPCTSTAAGSRPTSKVENDPGSYTDGHNADGGSSGPFVINPATGNKVRRNYKNMTKERRQEANARERSRVHTIGAAFEQLRAAVPASPHTSVELIAAGRASAAASAADGSGASGGSAGDLKLSKLAVLRIACKYILLLAAMSGDDYSADQCGYTVDECMDMLNETVANECKAAPPVGPTAAAAPLSPHKKSRAE